MLNTLSMLIGLAALLLVAIAFIPILGSANWLIIPMAIVGFGIGATSDRSEGRKLNLFVIAIGLLRLMLGGGLI